MKIKVEKSFDYGNKTLEAGETHEIPDSVGGSAIDKGYAKRAEEAEAPSIEPVEEGSDDRPTVEPRQKSIEEITEEMKESLDEEPTVPEKWNPAQSDNPDPEDIPKLAGRVTRVGKSRKHDTPFANVKTADGKTYSLFAHVALEDLFEEIKEGDLVAVKYKGMGTAEDSNQEFMDYRYELWDPQGRVKLSG